ncbi:hypothetical protein AB6A40_003896 [Gnathostoma spinigerum]|uniref:GPI ethanolamine phosphate transferase 2 C-terminal domain-containing protein n=1 Tax=Gnathostoma spinigerum TaxID=75299 RepID=A0ABD6ED42_9BILA
MFHRNENVLNSSTLSILCLLQIFAAFLFGFGFFTPQFEAVPSNSFRSSLPQLLRDENCTKRVESILSTERIDKMVLILIDAWQSEFFFKSPSSMPFVSNLTRHGLAISFEATLQAPTVTMPRIKAITSGIVPSFLDVIMNLASNPMGDDNILDRLKSNGKNIAFCGDNTWMKLFPSHFHSDSAGTTSFFVNDFTEVDKNVTDCMKNFMRAGRVDAWDFMILHYLGLDHIGHSMGPVKEQVDLKLKEMDTVVESVFHKLNNKSDSRWSLVILGDHGMTEVGSHGGSSHRETNVPIIFAGKLHKLGPESDTLFAVSAAGVVPSSSIQQIDIVPTVSSVFGIPIPSGNIGVTITNVLRSFGSARNQLVVAFSLAENAHQIKHLRNFNSDPLNDCIEEFISYVRVYCLLNGEPVTSFNESNCKLLLREAQKDLLNAKSGNYSTIVLFGIFISILDSACLITLSSSADGVREDRIYTVFLYLVIFARALTFFGSSLIEEEHDVVYFFYSSYLSALFLKATVRYMQRMNVRKKNYSTHGSGWPSSSPDQVRLILLLLLHRFCRVFTEGRRRRWLMELDPTLMSSDLSATNSGLLGTVTSFGSIVFSDGFEIMKSHLSLNTLLNIFTSVFVLHRFSSFSDLSKSGYVVRRLLHSLLLSVGLVTVVCKQLILLSTSTASVILAFLCFLILIVSRSLSAVFLLWILFLSRRELFPLIGLEVVTGSTLADLGLHPLAVVLAGWSAFFYAGNSNSFATVDIAVGYTGLSSYQPLIVGAQLLLNTYSGPLIVILSWSATRKDQKVNKQFDPFRDHSQLEVSLSLASFCGTTACMCSLFLQRHHLFVWTVFAPKYVYELVHLVVVAFTTVLLEIVGRITRHCQR